MVVVYARLSDAEMRGFAKSEAADPAIAKLYALERQFAEQRGGRTLDLWRLHQGRIFGLPWMMSLDDAAARLGIAEAEATALATELRESVWRTWKQTPEYRDSPYPAMHERRAQGLPAHLPREGPTAG